MNRRRCDCTRRGCGTRSIAAQTVLALIFASTVAANSAHLLAVINNQTVKVVARYRIVESFAWGKYLYVDDLLTDENNRANGSQ